MAAFDSTQSLVATTVEIFFVDLLLSADNAVVVALACRTLPQDMVKRAMIYGTAAAIVLRIVVAAVATVLLSVPGVKIAGAVALTLIAVKLMVGNEPPEAGEPQASRRAIEASRRRAFLNAVFLILAADFVMSLDNVIALAALARGNVGVLIFGLALSIPMLMFGSSIIHVFIDRYPILVALGSAFLGWIAGGIAMDDSLISTSADRQAVALSTVVPLLVALFVVVQARIIQREKARDAAVRGPRLPGSDAKVAAVAGIEANEPVPAVGSRTRAESKPKGPRKIYGVGAPSIALVLGLSLVAWVFTGFYNVRPGDEGLVLRFRRFVETTAPGLHYRVPMPVESVDLPKMTQVHQPMLGKADAGDRASGRQATKNQIGPCSAREAREATRRGRIAIGRFLIVPQSSQLILGVSAVSQSIDHLLSTT